MEGNFPDEEELERVRQLTERVINDPTFLRSPVLARLLRYLTAKTAGHETIKSYSIAFEGLGKQGSDQADVDTYARVAVARLRKALAAYYATQKDLDQIYIDSGTYQVRLRRDSAEQGAISIEAAASDRTSSFARILLARDRAWLLLAVIGLLAVLVGGLLVQRKSEQNAAKWKYDKFPTLGVISELGKTDAGSSPAQLTAQKQELIAALNEHNGFVVADRPAGETDYLIRLSSVSLNGVISETVTLTESASGVVVWGETYPVNGDNGLAAVSSSAVASIAPPNGALMGYLRRKDYDVNTPIGCWLRFTEGVQIFNTNGDAKLRQCAAAWYENAPDRRNAAFLYAWTLIDAAAASRNSGDRAATLKRAFEVLHRAIALNPDFALFHIAALRAYALGGNRAMVRQAAADAIRTGGHNRLVVGMAASTLAYWNDPSGEKILTGLASGDGEAYPWEHVGLFAAAMMRDDTTAAGQQVMEIQEFENGQPLLLIIKAAYASRMGKQDEATAVLARLRANPLIRLMGVSSLVDRLPIAPEVAHRLREWLPKDM